MEASQVLLPGEDESDEEQFAESTSCAAPRPAILSACKKTSVHGGRPGSKVGSASAARISRGDLHCRETALQSRRTRHRDRRPVPRVKDRVHSTEDARAAVDELDRLYTACNTSGKLADKKFNSIKFGAVDPPPPSNGFTIPLETAEPKTNTTVDIVMNKIAEFATTPCEKFLEMK